MPKSPGDIRRRAAKRNREFAVYQATMLELRVAGRSCATCVHRAKAPQTAKGKWCCELGSDNYSYQLVTMDHLCPQWAPK